MEDDFIVIEKEEKNYIYIYFFESHEKNKKVKLNLQKNRYEARNLKIVKKIESNNNYEISLYRFSLYPNIIKKNFNHSESYEILININNDKLGSKLTNLLFDQDNFIFDFKSNINSQNYSFQLSLQFQFIEYMNYLKEDLKCSQESKELNNLISSIQKYLGEKSNKFDFVTYLLILDECRSSESIQKHLDLFVQEKIELKENLDDRKIKEIENMLNTLESNLEQILSNISNHNQKKYYKIKFYSILFYFCRNFNKQKIEELIKNEIINGYIFKGFLNFHLLYQSKKLKNSYIQKLINNAQSFEELKIALKYGKNTHDIMSLINENYSKFLEFYIIEEEKQYKEKKKNINLTINFLSLITPKKDDDIKKILIQYQNIVTKIKMDKKPMFVIVPSLFLSEYIKIFNLNNFDNLVVVANLIDFIKVYTEVNEIQKNVNKNIHETGLSLISDKSITNMQLLYFFEYTHYYNPKFFKNNVYIKDNLNISLIDKDFLEKCQKLNWLDIFGDCYLKFVEELSSLINNSSDFNKLLKILNINKIKIPKKFLQDFSSILEKKYTSLYSNDYGKSCPNIIDDTEELLFFIDNNGLNVKSFNSNIKNFISNDLFYGIYMKILDNHKDLSIEFENIIFNFLVVKYNTNKDLFTQEIFSLNEAQNIKLFKKLLEINLFSQKEKVLNKYNTEHAKFISDIKGKIKAKEIKYNDINNFFLNNDTQKVLLERLLIINLMNDSESKKDMQNLLESFNYANKIIEDLNILIEDRNYFYKNSKINEIEQLEKLVKTIKESSFNTIENIPGIQPYLDIINEKEFNERKLKRNSLIFKEIYEKEREVYKTDDNKCLEESNNKLNEIKYNFFKQKNENENNIDTEFLKQFQSMKLNKESLNQEIDKLFLIFYYYDNKEEIFNLMIFLFYKNKILKLVYSLKDIIEITKVQKGFFYNLLKIIISYIEKNNALKILELSNQLLRVYSINIYDDNDAFIQLLIKFPDFHNIIQLYNELSEDKKEKLREKKIFQILENIIKIFEDKDKMSKIKDKELVQMIRYELTSNSSYNNEILCKFDGFDRIEMINI